MNVRLNLERLETALHVVIKKQRRLGYCFNSTEPTFAELENQTPNIKVIEKEEWQHLAEAQLLQRFENDEALYRIYILNDDATELLFVFAHAISDGISGVMFCQQILEEYGYVNCSKLLPQRVNTPLKPNLLGKTAQALNIKLDASEQTGINTFVLAPEEVKALMMCCEDNSFSIANLLSAAAVKANIKMLSKAGKINYFYPIDLREQEAHVAKYLHYNTGWLEFSLSGLNEISTIGLAALIRLNIKKSQKCNQVVDNLQNLKQDLSNNTAQQVVSDTLRKSPTVVVTGIDSKNIFANMPVKNIYMMVNCQAYLANEKSFMLTYNILHGQMFCTFIYVKTQIKPHMAKRICETMLEYLF